MWKSGLMAACLIAGVAYQRANAADLIGHKNLVSYIVTLDSISPSALLHSGGGKAIVEFSVTPKDKAKFAPKAVTLFIDDTPIDVTGVDEQGTYTVELVEGEDLPAVKKYAIQITVDNAQTGIQNVLVFDVDGILTPADNFQGRSQARLGLREKVELTAMMTPEGTLASDVGGLNWTITGLGSLSQNQNNDGTAVFDAGSVVGDTSLKLGVVSGTEQGKGKTYSRSIIAPSGETMTKSSGLFHTQGTASVGFKGNFSLLPTDVSFGGIYQREGAGTGIGSGFYSEINGKVHGYSVWISISGCNLVTGCVVNGIDNPATQKAPPFSSGDFLWPIRHEYCTNTFENCSSLYLETPTSLITIANHHQTADDTGRTCIQKLNAGPFCKDAMDASSSY